MSELKSKLLRSKTESLVPVKMDVFVHDAKVLADVREALAAGLTPSGFTVHDEVVVLRFDKREKAD